LRINSAGHLTEQNRAIGLDFYKLVFPKVNIQPLSLITASPLLVVMYFCLLLVGLSGMVISKRPEPKRGFRKFLRKRVLLVCPVKSISVNTSVAILTFIRIFAAISLGTDLGQTWDSLETILSNSLSLIPISTWATTWDKGCFLKTARDLFYAFTPNLFCTSSQLVTRPVFCQNIKTAFIKFCSGSKLVHHLYKFAS